MEQHVLHILIVEDSTEDRATYRRYLQQDPDTTYVIREATTGSRALELCTLAPPECLLLDYLLPDMNGTQFLRKLATLGIHRTIPIIMITGMGSEEIAALSMKLGVLDYLVKGSITSERLRHAIHNTLEKALLLHTVSEHQHELEKTKSALKQVIEENNLLNERMQEIRAELEQR